MAFERTDALRRGVKVESITIAWMAVEAAVALGAGIAARSVLLTAFGADSVVELLSGIVLYRRLSLESRGLAGDAAQRLEERATLMSAVLLVLLCLYVVATSAGGLLLQIRPAASPLGIAVAAVALVGMPVLAHAKRRVNTVLDSASLRADIAETSSCAYLAAVTLVGLVASTLFGWWWAQYVAALALLFWLLPETREALGGGNIIGRTNRGTGD